MVIAAANEPPAGFGNGLPLLLCDRAVVALDFPGLSILELK